MNEETEDVVGVLTAQHTRIAVLIGQILVDREDKRQLFTELVRLLAVHESAEEQVVHRTAKRAVFGAEDMVKSLLAEENRAKQYLADLYDLGVDHPEFASVFARFAEVVTEHAAREEYEEFPLLRRQFSETQLRRMAQSVRFAETIAPTRPHPNAGESAFANAVAGPPFAVFDRIRDALHGRHVSGRAAVAGHGRIQGDS